MSVILKDEQFLPVATMLAANAKKSIFISTFKAEISPKAKGTKLKKFFLILIQKARNGVDVRLLLNQVNIKGHIPASNAYAIRFFRSSVVKIRELPNNRCCHAKIIIIDKKTAICGSHNLSIKSCHYNFELSCVLTKDWSLLSLVTIYEGLWDASTAI